tara:strand:- start:146 stop:427 length:282 start_codon:yes stop_codon:yes gene_type:complete
MPSGGLAGFLPIILIVFIFYFFMIRPQINKQKEDSLFKSNIKKGDKVVTIGGIHGKVNLVKDGRIILEISDKLRITVDTDSISRDKSVKKTNN